MKNFDSTKLMLDVLRTGKNVSDKLPFSRDNFVKIPIRTKEQAIYAESLGKRIFVEERRLPNGNVFEFYYCLVNYDTAISSAL